MCTLGPATNTPAFVRGLVASTERDVVAITCFTETGRTARLSSAERTSCPVFAFMPDAAVRRANTINWGVVPLPSAHPGDTDEMVAIMDRGLQEHRLARPGQVVVMAAASPAGRTTTNMLKLRHVGAPLI